jgi:hypothetical protein
VDTAEHDLGRGAQAADLVGLRRAVHAEDPRSERLVSTGRLDLIGNARRVEGLRRTLMHLRPRRDEIDDDAFGFRAVPGAQNRDPVGFQRGGGSPHAGLLRRDRESTPNGAVKLGLDFNHEMVLLAGGRYLQLQILYALTCCICK